MTVAEQVLHGADVVAGIEHMGGEAVAKGVGRDGFFDLGEVGGAADGLLEGGAAEVVAPGDAAPRVDGSAG